MTQSIISAMMKSMNSQSGIPLDLLMFKEGQSVISSVILDNPRQLELFTKFVPVIMGRQPGRGQKPGPRDKVANSVQQERNKNYPKVQQPKAPQPKKQIIDPNNEENIATKYCTKINIAEYQLPDDDEDDLASLLSPQTQTVETIVEPKIQQKFENPKQKIQKVSIQDITQQNNVQAPIRQTKKIIQWQYIDASNNIQGPFSQSKMQSWFTANHLPSNLPIKLFNVDLKFVPLNLRWEATCRHYNCKAFEVDPLPIN